MKIVRQVEEEIIVEIDDFLEEYEIDDILDYIQNSSVTYFSKDAKRHTKFRFENEIKDWAIAKFNLVEAEK